MSNDLLNQIICVIAGRIIATEAGNVAGELPSQALAEEVVSAPQMPFSVSGRRGGSNPLGGNPELVPQQLRKHRVTAGLSQKTLAATLGVSVETFKNWEHGRTAPSRQFWPAITRLFGVRTR
jgi:DNA-binding XRE family transcriptional regulator